MKKRVLAMLIVFVLGLMWIPDIHAGAVTSQDGLWSYDRTEKKILRYYGDEETVTIPGTIDGWSMQIIGHGAFAGCSDLKSVDLGSYIKELETGAFAGCTDLKTVKGKKSVQIGDEAFRDCTSLKDLELEIGYKEIGHRAFENCRSLKEFTIPESITTIYDEAFKGCSGLKTIVLNEALITLGDGVFAGCTRLDGIWAPKGSTRFSNDAYGVLFNNDKTQLLAAPGGLTGTYVVPGSVERLSRYAFAGCDKLETVLIHDGVTNMGIGSFQYCTALKTVVLSGHRETTNSQFEGCTALETVVIGRACPNDTFADCTGLRSIYCYNARTDHAPDAFMNATANMYYVRSKSSLSQQELQPYQFGGDITWVPLEGYCVAKGDGSTYVIGSDVGAIFLIMAPWDKLVSVSVDGKVLSEEQYQPMTKGTSIILPDDYLRTLSLGKHDLSVVYSDGSCEATFILSDKRGCEHDVVIRKAEAPTCTQSGLSEGSYCAKCQMVLKEQKKIDALGHDHTVTTVAPTCTEAGSDLYVCSRCGSEERHNEVAALGHVFGQWETAKAPTVAEKGLSRRVCEACGKTEQKELERLTTLPTAPPVERPTEPSTGSPTEPSVELPAEPSVELPTEPSVELPTEPSVELPTEPSTELPTEPSTELPTEPSTQSPTGSPTELPADPTSAAPTEPSATTPTEKGPPHEDPVDLVPLIILGAVLLVATAAGVLYLFRKRS